MCVIFVSNTVPETLPGHVDDQRLVSIVDKMFLPCELSYWLVQKLHR